MPSPSTDWSAHDWYPALAANDRVTVPLFFPELEGANVGANVSPRA